MSELIYMDHNATTPVRPEATQAMAEALEHGWGNPSSGHWAGRRARNLLEKARSSLASLTGARADDIIFTGSATEAINTVIRSIPAGRIIISAVEHPAVVAAVQARPDLELERAAVDSQGRINLDEILESVDDDPPVLVAVMGANNETGVIQPVGELTDQLRKRKVPLLVDATQLIGKLRVSFRPDYLVLTAHKLGGPKGVGAIVLGNKAPLTPLVLGGGQERGLRGGTEGVPAIVGFGAAARVVLATREEEALRLATLRDRLGAGLMEGLPGSRILADEAQRLPNTLSYMLPEGVEAEAVMGKLNLAGVAVSAGSACHTGSPRPSKVLMAMGLQPEECFRVLRFSLGWGNDADQVERVIKLVCDIAPKLAG